MSADRKFFPIGSCFEWCKLIFRVEESESCKGCWFYDNTKVSCTSRSFHDLPDCGGLCRQDGKDVRFIRIGVVDNQ